MPQYLCLYAVLKMVIYDQGRPFDKDLIVIQGLFAAATVTETLVIAKQCKASCLLLKNIVVLALLHFLKSKSWKANFVYAHCHPVTLPAHQLCLSEARRAASPTVYTVS